MKICDKLSRMILFFGILNYFNIKQITHFPKDEAEIEGGMSKP